MLFAALVLATATPVSADIRFESGVESRFDLRSYYTGAEEVPVLASHDAIAIRVDEGMGAAAVAVLVEGAIDDKLASAGVAVAGAKRIRPGLFDIELARDVDKVALTGLAQALAPRVNGVWPVLTRRSGRAFSDDKLVVTAEPGHFEDVLARVIDKSGGALVRRSNIANTALVSVGDAFAHDAVNASAALHGMSGAVSIEPDLYRELSARSVTVNDPLFTTQWHLSRQGSTVPGVGQIFADVAWDTTMGDPSVVIAVFDTGVDLSHEDLENQFVGGFDAAGNDNDPSPECSASEDGAGQVADCPSAQPFKQSHATSVSGIIAAEANNGIGVTGVCPLCKIMPVRILGDDAASGLGIGEAFTRAVDEGAWAINNSWGPGASVFFPLSQAERDGLAHAKSTGRNGLGTVILFAAGNDTADVVSDPYAGNPQVITVAGSTNVDDWAEYSNFGKEIDVAAPTQGLPAQEDNFPDDDFGIVTTDLTGADGYDPGNYTNEFNGTSASCPVTTGVVGLVLSANPNLTDDQVRLAITRSADKIVADKVPWQDLIGQDIETIFAYDDVGHSVGFGFGRVNAASAVAAAQNPGLEGAKCDEPGCTFCDSLGRCLLECTQQSDCPDGSACNLGLGACELPQEKPASFLSPCIPDCPFCTATIDDEENLVDVCTAK
ncbi:MAG TPA: S8 family serine peptidase, partial [Myxococcota bacterium]